MRLQLLISGCHPRQVTAHRGGQSSILPGFVDIVSTSPGPHLPVSTRQSTIEREGCAPGALLHPSRAGVRGAVEGSATAHVRPSGFAPGACRQHGTAVRLFHAERYHPLHRSEQNHPPPSTYPLRKRTPPPVR